MIKQSTPRSTLAGVKERCLGRRIEPFDLENWVAFCSSIPLQEFGFFIIGEEVKNNRFSDFSPDPDTIQSRNTQTPQGVNEMNHKRNLKLKTSLTGKIILPAP